MAKQSALDRKVQHLLDRQRELASEMAALTDLVNWLMKLANAREAARDLDGESI